GLFILILCVIPAFIIAVVALGKVASKRKKKNAKNKLTSQIQSSSTPGTVPTIGSATPKSGLLDDQEKCKTTTITPSQTPDTKTPSTTPDAKTPASVAPSTPATAPTPNKEIGRKP
ncbi:hypothetical protein GCK32_021963, partial [Trichostrongylus colubriformis]